MRHRTTEAGVHLARLVSGDLAVVEVVENVANVPSAAAVNPPVLPAVSPPVLPVRRSLKVLRLQKRINLKHLSLQAPSKLKIMCQLRDLKALMDLLDLMPMLLSPYLTTRPILKPYQAM